jgi:hypothetical protein
MTESVLAKKFEEVLTEGGATTKSQIISGHTVAILFCKALVEIERDDITADPHVLISHYVTEMLGKVQRPPNE